MIMCMCNICGKGIEKDKLRKYQRRFDKLVEQYKKEEIPPVC